MKSIFVRSARSKPLRPARVGKLLRSRAKPAPAPPRVDCDITAVGRRRDGGTRFWCLAHKADATAKYGLQAEKCRYADEPAITADETLTLDLDAYPGGVACWGAVPPVYDTTSMPLDRGIHVHARYESGGPKEIDKTFRRVLFVGEDLRQGLEISELEAIYFMATSVFGYEMQQVLCTECGASHLDKDWFGVHPHRRHLCAACGRTFRDSVVSIGNPIAALRTELKERHRHRFNATKRKLELAQSSFQGGIQIWGSNPALLWTAGRSEEEGIHVHAFREADDEQPEIDETFSRVVIDGVALDALMVRTLMAQRALPHITGRVVSNACVHCGHPHFSRGQAAYTPSTTHGCEECGREFPSSGRLRKVVCNPLVRILSVLAHGAPRPLQTHDLGLLPETL
jgi:hypothetical protein